MLTKEVINAKIEILNKYGLMPKEVDTKIAKIRDEFLTTKEELRKEKETVIQKVVSEFDVLEKEAQQIQLKEINFLLESIEHKHAEPQPTIKKLKPHTSLESSEYILFNIGW